MWKTITWPTRPGTSGWGVGRFGVNGSDTTGAAVSGNVVVRVVGTCAVQGQPAMQIGNGGDGQKHGLQCGR